MTQLEKNCDNCKHKNDANPCGECYDYEFWIPAPTQTTADAIRAALAAMSAGDILAGKCQVLHNSRGESMPCYGSLHGDGNLTMRQGDCELVMKDDAINNLCTFPIPPPAPKNSEIVAVGQVWKDTDGDEATIVAVTDVDFCYEYDGADGKLNVIRRDWIDTWQLLREPEPKTLADMGIVQGAKLKYTAFGEEVLTIDSLRMTADGETEARRHSSIFNSMTLIQEAKCKPQQ